MSGLNSDIDKFIETLKAKKIKNIKLPVSAPFHCKLMDKATSIMKDKINNTNYEKNKIIIGVASFTNLNLSKKMLDEKLQKK